MPQKLLQDNIPLVVRAGNNSLSLSATFQGRPTRITIGGQQYKLSTALALATATAGIGGIDTGSFTAGTIYNIFAVQSSGTVGLIISTSATPTGFTSSKFLGKLIAATGATISHVMNMGEKFVEFVYNTNNAGSNDTSSFGYGIVGGQFPNGAVGTPYIKRVRWLQAFKLTDSTFIECTEDGVNFWNSANDPGNASLSGIQGTNSYGIIPRSVAASATDVDVGFQAGGRYSSNVSYAGNGAAWSGISSAPYAWRMVKISDVITGP